MASKTPASVLEQTHRDRDTLGAQEIQHQRPTPAERRQLDTMWVLHRAVVESRKIALLKFLDPAQPGQIIALPIAEAVIDAPQTLAINYPGFHVRIRQRKRAHALPFKLRAG